MLLLKNLTPSVLARWIDLMANVKCHYYGLTGHRIAECKKKQRDEVGSKAQGTSGSSRSSKKNAAAVTCYVCGYPGHVATACPDRSSGGSSVKEVHQCQHRLSRGNSKTSSGEIVSFLFNSVSYCCLLSESFREKFVNTEHKSI